MSANAFPFRHILDPAPSASSPLLHGPTEVVPSLVADNELFIRKAFADDAKLGCELLFRQYFAPLCSHAIRFMYDRQAAEDVVADLFYTFYQKELYKQIRGSYRAYLYQAVRNRAYNYLRWELNRQETLPDDLDPADLDAAQPDYLLQQDELYRALEQAVQQLSPQRQRVFLLSRFEGKSYKAIAAEMDLSPKTVENHLLRAVSTVRQLLRQQKLISWGLLLLTIFSNAQR